MAHGGGDILRLIMGLALYDEIHQRLVGVARLILNIAVHPSQKLAEPGYGLRTAGNPGHVAVSILVLFTLASRFKFGSKFMD